MENCEGGFKTHIDRINTNSNTDIYPGRKNLVTGGVQTLHPVNL